MNREKVGVVQRKVLRLIKRAHIPYQYRDHFTVWKQIVLKPGDQTTIPADTIHWFQAGPKGAVVSEFSSASEDQADIWTDPHLVRTSASKSDPR